MNDTMFWNLYELGQLEDLKIYEKKHTETINGVTWNCIDEMACFRYKGVCYMRFVYKNPKYIWLKRKGKGAKYIPGEFIHRSVFKRFESSECANKYFKACKGYMRTR